MIEAHDNTYPEITEDDIEAIKASKQKMCKTDNRFQAYYRYRQSLWRKKHKIPVKKNEGQKDEEVYGNFTSDPEANFMTDGIRALVNHHST